MQLYRYWARQTREVSDDEGRAATLAIWRWSNVDVAEARARASEALAALVRRWQEGGELNRYAYADRPLREEVVDRLDGADGEPAAVITRNAYGSLVLNTTRVMFIDIDNDSGGPLASLKKLFAPNGRGELDRVREVVDRHPELNLRIYRTFKGLRCLVTSDLYDPADPAVTELLREFGSDPLYVKLCSVQQCFRARLTPKHWRIDVCRPPSRWPWDDAEQERRYREWQRGYETAARAHGTCELLESVGCGRVRFEAEPIIELHDRMACSTGGNGLA